MIDPAILWKSNCEDIFAFVAFNREEDDFPEAFDIMLSTVGKNHLGNRVPFDEGDKVEFIWIDDDDRIDSTLKDLLGDEDYAEKFDCIVVDRGEVLLKRSI